MMFAVRTCVALMLVAVQCVHMEDHSLDPDYYRCPFGLFDAGRPVMAENGGVMYCDVDGVRCPNFYFCSGGYQDGRAVCCHILVIIFLQRSNPVLAYYRCDWVPGEEERQRPVPSDSDVTLKTRQCYFKDSDIMSNYINYCTNQRLFIKTCSNTGRWDCSTLVGFCKTLINVKPPSKDDRLEQKSGTGILLPAQTGCIPDRTHFSLQEMSLAVLVSFISGSVILSAIVVVIWKCRHTKWESEQSKTERRQREQRTAALNAITQIARVLNPSSSDSDTVFYLNPAYSRTVASDIIDMISENDHIYEEVMLRRMSSCLARSTQMTPNTSKKKKSQTGNSLNSVMEVAENRERHIGDSDVEPVDAETDTREGRARVDAEAPSTSDSGYME